MKSNVYSKQSFQYYYVSLRTVRTYSNVFMYTVQGARSDTGVPARFAVGTDF